MAKILKNVCLIALLFIFSFSSFGFSNLNINTQLDVDAQEENTQELNLVDGTNSIKDILNNYRTKANKGQKNFNGYVYNDTYAGMWYDEDQQLNIGVTVDENNKKSNIKYTIKEFSFNQLTKLHSILVDIMNDYSIFSVGISQKNNKVTVELIEESQVKNIKTYLYQLPNFNKKLIDVIEFNLSKEPELVSGSAAGGRMALVWNPDTEEYISSGTITGIAIDNETGELGVVTCHHVAEQGMRVERGGFFQGQLWPGPVFGISSKSQFIDNVDASFIPFNNDTVWNINSSAYYWQGSQPFNYEPNNNVPITYKVAVESEIIEGASVTKFGDISGRTDGTITDIYASITANGTTFNNQIKHNAYLNNGDSGSPLFIKNGDRFILSGINNIRTTNIFGFVAGYANKITDVQRELNITFIQPFNSLQSFTINNVFDLLEQNNDPVESFFEGISVVGNEYLGAGNFYNAKEALEYYVAYPQGEERINGTHYYITRNQTKSDIGGYYKNGNGNYSRSARTRLEDHYSTALNAYHNNDIENAIKFLGYAIHYIFDLGNTVYTTGATGSGPKAYLNYLFREFDNPSKTNFHSTNATIDALYGTFSNTFENMVNSIATSSANGIIPNGTSFYNAINTVRSGADEVIYYDPIIEWTLPQIEKYVAAVLHQFYTDTVLAETTPTHRSEAVIKDGNLFFIKNLKSGFYIDVKGWGTSENTALHQFSFSGDKNQIFVAIYHDSTSDDGGGYFNFMPAHTTSKRLSFNYGLFQEDGDCVLKNPTNSKYQRFRITYLEDGKYRVMTGASNYAKILRSASNASGSTAYDLRQLICELAFNPNSINHYWSFERVKHLSPTTVINEDFKENVFYRIYADSTGNRTFTSTISNINFFEIGYRTGTGNSTYTRVANSTTSTQDFTVNMVSGRIYYLKVNNKDAILPSSNTSLTSNINIGSKDEIYVRLLPPSKRAYTFKSVNQIEFYNHAGTLIPINHTIQSGKKVYTITFNVNDTIYVRYQKVSGTNYIDFEMTS